MDQQQAPDLLAGIAATTTAHPEPGPEPVEGPVEGQPATGPALASLSTIWSTPALAAFLDVRAEQLLRYGHSPAADRAQPVDKPLREARDRVVAALDRAAVDPAAALRKVAIAGALLLAAHDRLSAEIAARAALGAGEGA